MVDTSGMSLFQLRTYRAWLERSKAEFRAENPKIKNDLTLGAKLKWYDSEFAIVNYRIENEEAKQVRLEMDAKAQKFLGVVHRVAPPVSKKSNRFKRWLYNFNW